MRYFVTLAGRTFEVDLGAEAVTVDGEPVDVALAHVNGSHVRSLLMDGASHRLLAHKGAGGAWEIHVNGRRYDAEAIDERTRAIREMTGSGSGASGPKPVRAPMPGLVVKIEVAVGDRVEAGQGVAIVEAMKMENELKAESAAVVREILVEAGQAVEKDQILIDLADPDEAGDEGSTGEEG